MSIIINIQDKTNKIRGSNVNNENKMDTNSPIKAINPINSNSPSNDMNTINDKNSKSPSSNIDKLNTSFISTNSNYPNKITNSTNWGKKNRIHTCTVKNLYDEINRVEAEKCLDHMDNLNNLSNILKSKNNHLAKLKTHSISSTGDIFLYKNIIKGEINNQIIKEKPNSNFGNMGFISDEVDEEGNNCNTCNNCNQYNHLSQTRAIISGNVQTMKEENDKVNKLNQRIETIRHTLSTSNNEGAANGRGNISMSRKPVGDSSVKLTCFQRLCGGK